MAKVQRIDQSDDDLEAAYDFDVVVPDHTGTILIAFYHERGESRVASFPVIAWNVTSNGPKPITVDKIDTSIYCLKLSTELWVFRGDTTFDSEEKALEYGMSRAKLRRECK